MHRQLSLLAVSAVLFACGLEEIDVNTPWAIPGQGGVNLLLSPDQIRDDELAYAKNVVPRGTNGFTKRPSMQYEATINTGDYYPLAMAFPPRETQTRVMVAAHLAGQVETRLFALDDSGAVVSLALAERVQRPAMMTFGDKTYVFPGYPGTDIKKLEFDAGLGFAVIRASNFNGSGNTSLSPRVAGRYRSRAVYANFGPGYERHLIFSDNFLPMTVGDSALTSRSIFVGDSGDRIVAVVELMTTGTQIQPVLLVLLQHSAYIVNGEPNQTTDSPPFFGDLEVSRLPYNAGCAAPETIAVTPQGTFWAGPDNAWGFKQGQGLISVGAKIRPVLERTPDVMRYRWTAAYFDGFYRLAVFSEDQEMTDTAPLGEQWWLDLEQPVSDDSGAKWFGPQQFNLWDGVSTKQGTYLMGVDDRPGANSALFGVERSAIRTSPPTTIVALTSYGKEPAERDAASVPYTHPDIVDTEILLDVRSKAFGLESGKSSLDKTFRKGELTVYTTENGRLIFEANNDRGRQFDTVSKDINKYGAAVSQVLDGEELTEQVQSLAYWPEPTTRTASKVIQFRTYDESGYLVDSSNDEFVFEDSGNGGSQGAAQIPHGLYTMTELLTAITNAMAAINGNVYTPQRTLVPSGHLSIQTNSGGSITLDFQSNPAASGVQLAKTRALGAMLGYNISANVTGVLAVESETPVYESLVPAWELHDMTALVRITGKRSQ